MERISWLRTIQNTRGTSRQQREHNASRTQAKRKHPSQNKEQTRTKPHAVDGDAIVLMFENVVGRWHQIVHLKRISAVRTCRDSGTARQSISPSEEGYPPLAWCTHSQPFKTIPVAPPFSLKALFDRKVCMNAIEEVHHVSYKSPPPTCDWPSWLDFVYEEYFCIHSSWPELSDRRKEGHFVDMRLSVEKL